MSPEEIARVVLLPFTILASGLFASWWLSKYIRQADARIEVQYQRELQPIRARLIELRAERHLDPVKRIADLEAFVMRLVDLRHNQEATIAEYQAAAEDAFRLVNLPPPPPPLRRIRFPFFRSH